MDYLFLNGFATTEATEKLRESNCYSLVRELVFKFDLRVLRESTQGYFMCYKNGIVVGRAYVANNDEGKPEYHFNSPYFRKQRGKSEQDRNTLSSVKLNSLMTSIKKIDAIKDEADFSYARIASKLADGMSTARSSLGRSYKNHNLPVDAIHALLAHYFGENPDSLNLSIPVQECKESFDKLNETDKVIGMKEQLVMDTFHKPFYFICGDSFGDVSVGKFQVTSGNSEDVKFDTIEPLRRYKDVKEEYPEVMPILTMTKVVYEGRGADITSGYIPAGQMYNSELSAAFTYESMSGAYGGSYMMTPC